MSWMLKIYQKYSKLFHFSFLLMGKVCYFLRYALFVYHFTHKLAALYTHFFLKKRIWTYYVLEEKLLLSLSLTDWICTNLNIFWSLWNNHWIYNYQCFQPLSWWQLDVKNVWSRQKLLLGAIIFLISYICEFILNSTLIVYPLGYFRR